tara:strand:- start:244 stop:1482 length:1239 start_codon:yes stop_codon:yes gene_type:complete
MKNIKYDLVVFGATGFTGTLVAEYLAREYGVKNKKFVWAIAGRDNKKLDDLKTYLLEFDSEAKSLPTLVADSYDKESLDSITSISRVLISTVGPYLKYGKLLVRSCANNGTDYCDLTGEVPFIRESIDSFDTLAKNNKCRIIHSCGFDSVPSDIGVLILQQEAKIKFGKPFDKIKLYARGMKGGLSGGTIESMINISSYISSKPELSGLLGNPYALNPDGQLLGGPDGSSLRSVKWDEKTNLWTCPFIMSGINTRVVRRSNALMGFLYGKDFKYSEVYSFNKGFFGFIRSVSMLIGMAFLKVAISFRLSLWLLRKLFLPRPGQGPSKENRESGYFKVLLVGFSEKMKIKCVVTGDRDPGYAGTAIMLSESALSILLEKESIPDITGVLTPASGIGGILVSRLKDKGITFKIE